MGFRFWVFNLKFRLFFCLPSFCPSSIVSDHPATLWVILLKVYGDVNLPLSFGNPPLLKGGTPPCFVPYYQRLGKLMAEDLLFHSLGQSVQPSTFIPSIYWKSLSLFIRLAPNAKAVTAIQRSFSSSVKPFSYQPFIRVELYHFFECIWSKIKDGLKAQGPRLMARTQDAGTRGMSH